MIDIYKYKLSLNQILHTMQTIKLFISIAFIFFIVDFVRSQNENFLLMVVDVQDFEIIKEEAEEEEYHEFLKEVNGAIELFEPEKVIYIKDMSLALSLSFKGKSVDTVSFPNLDAQLNVVNSQIFTKTEGDSFTAKGLEDFLQKHSDYQFLVVGLIADGCIFSTLKSGRKKGYEMYIIPEAIWARSEKNKTKYLAKYKKIGVKTYDKN